MEDDPLNETRLFLRDLRVVLAGDMWNKRVRSMKEGEGVICLLLYPSVTKGGAPPNTTTLNGVTGSLGKGRLPILTHEGIAGHAEDYKLLDHSIPFVHR